MLYGINEYDPAEIQMFITEHKLYNLKSTKTFNKLLNGMDRLKVEGLGTKQDKWHPSAQENIYNRDKGLFIIDGNPYEIKFVCLKRNRHNFYHNDDGELFLMTVFEIIIKKSLNDELFNTVRSNGIQKENFSFVINIKMPMVDTMAVKILMEN